MHTKRSSKKGVVIKIRGKWGESNDRVEGIQHFKEGV